MPRERRLWRDKESADRSAAPEQRAISPLAAAVEALGVSEDEVIGYREYPAEIVIVTRDGRKLASPRSSRGCRPDGGNDYRG